MGPAHGIGANTRQRHLVAEDYPIRAHNGWMEQRAFVARQGVQPVPSAGGPPPFSFIAQKFSCVSLRGNVKQPAFPAKCRPFVRWLSIFSRARLSDFCTIHGEKTLQISPCETFSEILEVSAPDLPLTRPGCRKTIHQRLPDDDAGATSVVAPVVIEVGRVWPVVFIPLRVGLIVA